MVSEFKKELDKFWNWAQISFDDYVSGVFPPVARQPEWEGEYLNWESLASVTEELILQFNKTQEYDKNDLRGILTVLAIDNESEGLQQFLTMTLTTPRFAHDLIEVSRSFESFHARWQMVEIVKSGQIADKASRLELFIKNDRDQYVQRRALMALSEVNSDLAIHYAKIKIKDEDEYMRLTALDVLKMDDNYTLYKNSLKDDPSPLIKRHLKE